MDKKLTERGFEIIEFEDFYGEKCDIQKSLLATNNCIWLGLKQADPIIRAKNVQEDGVGWVKYPIHRDVMINTRMHLSKEQVKELLPILEKFVKTGDI